MKFKKLSFALTASGGSADRPKDAEHEGTHYGNRATQAARREQHDDDDRPLSDAMVAIGPSRPIERIISSKNRVRATLAVSTMRAVGQCDVQSVDHAMRRTLCPSDSEIVVRLILRRRRSRRRVRRSLESAGASKRRRSPGAKDAPVARGDATLRDARFRSSPRQHRWLGRWDRSRRVAYLRENREDLRSCSSTSVPGR